MRWVRVRNEFGEMLALHSYSVGFTLYPVSMVAERAREDRHVDVRELYKSFVTDLHL
jgi:hypothetical protein